MALTLGNTGFNGGVRELLQLILGVGNQTVQKGSIRTLDNISTKRALPKLSATDDPIGAFETVPSGDTITTTYAEQELIMEKGMVYETFNPTNFHDLWEIWRSIGDFTNLQLNPRLMSAVLDLYANKIGTQVSKLIWQGDKAGSADVAMFDGLIKKIDAASPVRTTPAGVITSGNVIAIVQAVWEDIPDQFFGDMDYKIHMNTTDFKLLNAASQTTAATTNGVLGNSIKDLFLQQRIVHYSGLPKDRIVAAKGTATDNSNLFFGVWVPPAEEAALIDRVANNSREWFIRLDFKMDVNFIQDSEIVFYEPV